MIRPVVASVSQHTKTTTSHDGIGGSDQDSMMHIIHIDTTHTTVERHRPLSQKGNSSIIDNHTIVVVLLGVAAILVAIGATTSSIFVVTDTTAAAAAAVASHRTVRRNNENKLPPSQQQQQQRRLHAQTQDQHPRTLSTHNQHQFETATVHSLGSSGSGSSSSAPSKTKMNAEPNEHITDQQDKKSKSVNDENNIKEERAKADYPTKYDYQTTYHYTNPNKVATLRDDPTKKKTKKDYEVFDPQIAWLASFPNSGTSFTLTLVARATNTTFATNYGLEATYGRRDTPSLPIYARHPEGPFMPDPVTSFHHRDLPYGRHVITKTHCGGSCVNCGPTTYAYGYNTDTDKDRSTSNTNTITTTTNNNNNNTESNDSDNASLPSPPLQFLQDCASGHAIDGHGNMIDVSYPPERVSRVIHMIRNPFHNAIARFHLERKHHSDANTTHDAIWLEEHPDNGMGMNKFCQEMDEDRRAEELQFFRSEYFIKRPSTRSTNDNDDTDELAFTRRNGGKSDHHKDLTTPNTPSSAASLSYDSTDEELETVRHEWLKIVENVPCRGDFFRYIQWHNLLHQALDYLPYKLPVLSVYYEDYQNTIENEHRFMDTAQSILDFLHLQPVAGDKRGNIKWTNFESRTDYDGFFTSEQQDSIEKFLYTLASYQVWGELQHYF